MEVNSEKYAKLIELAQKFDACQNDLLHYQKQEIVDNWNTYNLDFVSDHSSSMLNIKKISKKTKRAKSCFVRCADKPNSKSCMNKISPPKKKTSLTKQKTANSFDLKNKGPLKNGIFLKGKYEDIFRVDKDKSKKWNSNVYVRPSRSGYLGNNNNHKDIYIDNTNVEKKTKLKRIATTLKSMGTKEAKYKANVPVEKQEEHKKKLKVKRKNNTFTTKKNAIVLTKSPSSVKNHSKNSRSKEKAKEHLKKKKRKVNHFMKRKKRNCLKKKRIIRLKNLCNLHNVECNDSVDSAGSVISADTLDTVHISKTEENELLLVSLRDPIRQWTPLTVTGRGMSDHLYGKHKPFTFNINKELPKKHISIPPNDSNEYTTSELNKKENEQNKQEPLMNNNQSDINKHLDINKTNMKYSHRSENISPHSYQTIICKNSPNTENKRRKQNFLQKSKEAVQWTNAAFSENRNYSLVCDTENACNSISNSITSEAINNTSSGVEKQKTSKQLDVQAYKKLLKALNESAFITITKKRQQKKSRHKKK